MLCAGSSLYSDVVCCQAFWSPPASVLLLQLVGHPFIKPSSIQSGEVLDGYAGEYLYLAAVKFVKQVGERWQGWRQIVAW